MNISGMVLGLIGGLGLFLYGMTLMSDSLEKAAGAKLRGVLELFTKNRYVGIIVGRCVYGDYTVLQCCNGYGCQLCKCRSDDALSGYWRYLWC